MNLTQIGRRIMALCMLLLFAFCHVAPAAQVVLNTAEVPVASQSAEDRQAAMQAAFFQVLTKYSGNEQVQTVPELQLDSAQIEQMLSHYSYQANPDQAALPWLFQATFDEKPVKRLLSQAREPLWSAKRPAILFMVDVRAPQTDESTSMPWWQLAHQWAGRRGLVMLHLLGDMSDQEHMPPEAHGPLDQASWVDFLNYAKSRYQTPVVLRAEVVPQADQTYQASWSMNYLDKNWQWQSQGAIDTCVQNGVNEAANQLAEQMAVVPVSQALEHVTVWISGVGGLDNYAQLLRSVRQLSGVEDADMLSLNPRGVLLDVQTLASLEDLQSQLQQSPYLSRGDEWDSHAPKAALYFAFKAPEQRAPYE